MHWTHYLPNLPPTFAYKHAQLATAKRALRDGTGTQAQVDEIVSDLTNMAEGAARASDPLWKPAQLQAAKARWRDAQQQGAAPLARR